MSVPFINLQTQYQSLKAEINRRIDRVLEHGQYILGPEVDELEEGGTEPLADFCGVILLLLLVAKRLENGQSAPLRND